MGHNMIIVKNASAIAKMLKATELSAAVLEYAGNSIRAGMSTYELDQLIYRYITKHGATPSFLNYRGFTGSACISINEELIHGIPSKKRRIREGDIVSIDVGAYIDGYHGDNAKTFAVGKVSEDTERLLQVTEQSLYEGIKKAVPGNRVGDISNAIQTYCEDRGFYIVKEYIGHGVGEDLHEKPDIPNYGRPGRGDRLVPGMTLAIEPMVNSSTAKIRQLSDGWTIVEGNGNNCAHFEHTIAITQGEPFIMTRPKH